MIYKDGTYYFVKFQYRGKLIRRSTRSRTRKGAIAEEARIRTEVHREHAEMEQASARFGCDPALLARCPECNQLLRSDRAAIGVDGKKLCGDSCRETWDRRCNPVPNLRDFLEREFLPFIRAQFRAQAKTADYYRYGTELLLAADLGSLRLTDITSQHAGGFLAHHSRLSPSTQNCGLRTLRRALRCAEDWGKLGKLQRAPRIALAKGERQRERIVSDAEFAAYIELCRQPWRDLAVLIFGEAIRPGEGYELQWEHVLLNGHGGLIQIARGKSKAARRVLPMVPEVYRALSERWEQQGKPSEGWVFPTGSTSGHLEESTAKIQHAGALKKLAAATTAHKAWSKNGSPGDWREWVATTAGLDVEFVSRHAPTIKSGLAAFEPYCLRHTALTRLASVPGCDAFTLAKIAGHSSITITQRYIHPQADAIERAFAAPQRALVLVEGAASEK